MVIELNRDFGTQWSVLVKDIDSGAELFSADPQTVLATASIGKLFLLHRLLHEVDAGTRKLEETVTRQPFEQIDDSGLWYLMQQNTLSLYDVAVLIGAFSDNAATNTLTRVLGIETVREHASSLGYKHSRLNDVVRWPRPVHKPQQLSVGNAEELVRFVTRLANAEDLSESSSDILQRWLGAGADLSMVAQPFNLDPLAHYAYDRDIWFWNKTGTIGSARADVGLVMNRERRVAYAAIAQWQTDTENRDAVLANMAEIGELIGQHLGFKQN
ncbi:serine hydrolase [Canibacter zhoujuaniae]|uniref:serine hydrolase n=1 Tax=Canibacter zhoujuaniae TaxID=2708343 RepID=UPI00141EC1A8|nr:serine hydrolase [Canibacter zhoujuaniae]